MNGSILKSNIQFLWTTRVVGRSPQVGGGEPENPESRLGRLVQSQRCSEFSGIRCLSPVFERWPKHRETLLADVYARSIYMLVLGKI